MTVKEDILQAARAWLKTASTLTDAQVIPADDDGPRPPLPYLTVKVTTPGTMIGSTDERIQNATPAVAARGARRAGLTVNAYGDEAAEWLSEAVLALALPSVADALDAAGVTIDAFGGPTDISAVLDDAVEARVVQEFEALYALTSGTEGQVEATTILLDYTAGDLNIPAMPILSP